MKPAVKNNMPAENRRAFTLLEVMIAAGVLFLCLFAILGLVAMSLRNARALQQRTVDATLLAAELSITNKLSEGSDSGDFGDLYPEYEWTRDISIASSNGLYEVDFKVYRRAGGRPLESKMNILLYSPQSASGRP